jgi:hypothetical protein
MDSESGMDDAEMGMRKKKLLKTLMSDDDKS